jgi:hypothetical protein
MHSDTFTRWTHLGRSNPPALRPKPSSQHTGRAVRTLLRFEGVLSFAWVVLALWASWGVSNWLLAGWEIR